MKLILSILVLVGLVFGFVSFLIDVERRFKRFRHMQMLRFMVLK